MSEKFTADLDNAQKQAERDVCEAANKMFWCQHAQGYTFKKWPVWDSSFSIGQYPPHGIKQAYICNECGAHRDEKVESWLGSHAEYQALFEGEG